MKKYLNIIFIGTSIFGLKYLNNLLYSKHKINYVFTKFGKFKSPIKSISKIYNIKIFQPKIWNKIKEEFLKKIINSDIVILIAYGLKIPKNILNLPKFGFINIHASLLPKWRGPSPIFYSVLYGEKNTGISIIKMNEKIDKGKIIYKKKCLIKKNQTTKNLFEKIIKIGLKSIFKLIKLILYKKIKYKKQNEKLATYTKKINKKNTIINWLNSAYQINRCIKAFNPWPLSKTNFNNKEIKIWKANIIKKNLNIKPGKIYKCDKKGIQINTMNKVLNIKFLQFPNKKKISSIDYFNSYYIKNKILLC